MKLIKDDSGERDGYWFGERFIPGEVVRGIVKRERLRATRIVKKYFGVEFVAEQAGLTRNILGKGNRHEK